MNFTGDPVALTSNTTLTNCQNITFNLSRGDDYKLTLYVNNTQGNTGSDFVNFSIELTAPAIELNAPDDEVLLNYSTDIYFNFTATNNSYGLDTCQLWGNWTGTWHNNYTWIKPTNATMNYTTVNISDGDYKWNVWCNNTNNDGAWGFNRTVGVDTTFPTIDVGIVSVFTGSPFIFFYPNIDDENLNTCWFSIFDSLGNIESDWNNITFPCDRTTQTIAVVSAFETYDLFIYVNDLVGHETSSSVSFTTSPAPLPPPGVGGGAEEEPEPEPKTFCGDGICQAINDYGFRENYWSCPQDCPGFDLDALLYALLPNCFDGDPDTLCFWTQGFGIEEIEPSEEVIVEKINMETLFFNCVDDDETTPCFWQTKQAIYILFGGFGLFLTLSMIKIKAPGEKRKVSGLNYIKLRYKKTRRRWRR